MYAAFLIYSISPSNIKFVNQFIEWKSFLNVLFLLIPVLNIILNSPNLVVLLALWQLDSRYSPPSGMVRLGRAIFDFFFYIHFNDTSYVSAKLQASGSKTHGARRPKTAQIWWFCWWQLHIRYSQPSGMVCRAMFVNVFLFKSTPSILLTFLQNYKPQDQKLMGLASENSPIVEVLLALAHWQRDRYPLLTVVLLKVSCT